MGMDGGLSTQVQAAKESVLDSKSSDTGSILCDWRESQTPLHLRCSSGKCKILYLCTYVEETQKRKGKKSTIYANIWYEK